MGNDVSFYEVKKNIKQHKPIFSKEDCYSCWHCEVCKITGCENRSNSYYGPSRLESECPGPPIAGKTSAQIDTSNIMVSGAADSVKVFTIMKQKDDNKLIRRDEEVDYVHIENLIIKPFLVIGNEGYYPQYGDKDWVGCYETIEEARAVAAVVAETKDNVTIIDLRKYMYWSEKDE